MKSFKKFTNEKTVINDVKGGAPNYEVTHYVNPDGTTGSDLAGRCFGHTPSQGTYYDYYKKSASRSSI